MSSQTVTEIRFIIHFVSLIVRMENKKGKSERHIIHSLQTFTERDNEDIHEDIFVNINKPVHNIGLRMRYRMR